MGYIIPGATDGCGKGTGFTVTVPPAAKDGDVILVWIASTAGPGTAFTPPSGYVVEGAQKDGTSSFAGRAGLFRHNFTAGDTMAPVFSGPTGTIGWICMVVRSDTTAASVTSGNPPATAYSTAYSVETTVAQATVDFEKFEFDVGTDLRLAFAVWLHASATVTPIISATGIPFRVPVTALTGIGALMSMGAWWTNEPDPTAGYDGATSTWAVSVNSKSFTISTCLNDGTSTPGTLSGEEWKPYVMDSGVVVSTLPEIDEVAAATAGTYGGGVSIYTHWTT